LPLEILIQKIKTISKSEDVPLFIKDFAEDGMSDLLTNILHEKLNTYNVEVFNRYGIVCNGESSFYTWSEDKEEWEKVNRKGIFLDKKGAIACS